MGSQDYIVTGKHMSRCHVCGARTVLTKEIFRSGKWETLSICYGCQTMDLPEQPTKNLRNISSKKCAAEQPPLEKWITTH